MSINKQSKSIYSYRGTSPRIANDVFIATTASVIGDVEIGAGSSVWFSTVVRGDEGLIRIGERSNLQDGVIVHSNAGDSVTIGDDVTIGHGAIIHGCTIHSAALIGMGAVILDNATVEAGAQVAAGAVVGPGKTIPAATLWAGCPARQMRELSDESGAAILRSAEGYHKKSRRYLSGEVERLEYDS